MNCSPQAKLPVVSTSATSAKTLKSQAQSSEDSSKAAHWEKRFKAVENLTLESLKEAGLERQRREQEARSKA
jgi:hypothetical protein